MKEDYMRAWIHMYALAGLAFSVWTLLPTDYPGAIDPTPEELQDDYIIGKIPPMTITLRFREPSFIEREATPNTHAYTLHNKRQCTITFPAGEMIDAKPNEQFSAHWVNPQDNETMAHEILHCVRGQWHPGVGR